jgi:large subunit ribosomal protein L30
MNSFIAVIRIRGRSGVAKKVNDTLDMMRLFRQNGCVIIPNTPVNQGMIRKAKDYITWGEIDEETFKELVMKRGKVAGNKPLTEAYLKDNVKVDFDTFVKHILNSKIKLKEVPGLKPYFRLTPPRQGFERQGIKRSFSMGGALGYRKDAINVLIRRMI